MGFKKLLDWWTHSHARKVVDPNSIRTEAPVCLYLAAHLYFLYYLLYNISVICVSLSSVSCSNKLWKTWGGVVRIPIDSWSTRNTGDIWDLWLVYELGGQSCRTDPLICGTWDQLQVDNVNWIVGQQVDAENWLIWKKPTHLVAWSVIVLAVESKGTQLRLIQIVTLVINIYLCLPQTH